MSRKVHAKMAGREKYRSHQRASIRRRRDNFVADFNRRALNERMDHDDN